MRHPRAFHPVVLRLEGRAVPAAIIPGFGSSDPLSPILIGPDPPPPPIPAPNFFIPTDAPGRLIA